MIKYCKRVDGKMIKTENYEPGCWISCVSPTDEEITYLMSNLKIEHEFLRASLDEEESSRIDKEDENTLIIIDNPVVNKSGKNLTYYTMPLSIIITKENIITITQKESTVIEEFETGLIKNTDPANKNRFALQLIFRIAIKYLKYLNQINKITERIEEELKKTMQDKELIQFLEIEKSLVYFSSSLKSIGIMLGRISRRRYIRLDEDDNELLEDVIIEIKQATEMSEIYLNILTGTMDMLSTLISNNLNSMMKILASITLILSIPTIISGIYGMNNPGLPLMEYWWAPFIMTIILMFITTAILKKKNML